jgi:hypothetical protein
MAARKHAPLMRAPRAALLTLVLALPALAGCTVYDDVQRFVNRAAGKDEFAEVQKLSETLDFAVVDVPSVPPAGTAPEGKVTSYNFTVVAGAKTLHVDVAVRFRQEPVVIPAGVPQGSVNVTLTGPQGTARTMAFAQAGFDSFEASPPAAGIWGVRVATLGEGQVRLLAVAQEPVR